MDLLFRDRAFDLPLALPKWCRCYPRRSEFGFIGISYVTFRALDVIFGIQDELITALAAGQYLATCSSSRRISSGPIDRYRRFTQDWQRRTRPDRISRRPRRRGAAVFQGFLYKFIMRR